MVGFGLSVLCQATSAQNGIFARCFSELLLVRYLMILNRWTFKDILNQLIAMYGVAKFYLRDNISIFSI